MKILVSGHHGFDISFYFTDRLYVEVLDKHLDHIGGEESWQGRSEADAFHAQGQQGEKYRGRFLLVPGDIERDRELVDVIKTEDLLELESDDGERV